MLNEVASSLDAIVNARYIPIPLTLAESFFHGMLIVLAIVVAIAAIIAIVMSKDTFLRGFFAVLGTAFALSLYLWSGGVEASGQAKVAEAKQQIEERDQALLRDHCPRVLEAIRTNVIRELEQSDVHKIRHYCTDKSFFEAVNAPDATLDITFSDRF